MGQQHLLIPARFLLTTGHLVAVIMAYFNHETNLDAGLGANPSGSEYGKEKEKVRGVDACAGPDCPGKSVLLGPYGANVVVVETW